MPACVCVLERGVCLWKRALAAKVRGLHPGTAKGAETNLLCHRGLEGEAESQRYKIIQKTMSRAQSPSCAAE